TAAQVPRLVAADVEETARKVRQQLVVKPAKKFDRARMIRRKCRGESEEIAGRTLARPGDFCEFSQARMFEKVAQVAEGILVWHEVNAELATVRVERPNLGRRQRAPVPPGALVFAVGERVLGVELELVYLEIGQMLNEFE